MLMFFDDLRGCWLGEETVTAHINWNDFCQLKVLAATQMPGEAAGWFQGTADAVRKFIWVLEVNTV